MKPVAILGVGPAGLMAAQAVALSGRPVALFSQPGEDGNIKRSRLGGAQFLHRPIIGVNDEDEPDAIITFNLIGTPEVYRHKVYGTNVNVKSVSMEHVHDGLQQPAWNLLATYDKLWDLLSVDQANVVEVTPGWLDEALKGQWFDKVISTVPLPAICRVFNDGLAATSHAFLGQTVRIVNEPMIDEWDTIVYSGDPEQSWSRSSILFGYGSTEYGEHVQTPLTSFTVRKPISTNCDCYAGTVLRAGRYGTWTKGVLTHDAFIAAARAVIG